VLLEKLPIIPGNTWQRTEIIKTKLLLMSYSQFFLGVIFTLPPMMNKVKI